MGKCEYCEREMIKGKGCLKHYYILPNGEQVLAPLVGEHPRDHTDEGEICHDCDAPIGSYHHIGCDNEFCLRCGGQIIFNCTCEYTEDVVLEKELTAKQKKDNEERDKASKYYNSLSEDDKLRITKKVRAMLPAGATRAKIQKLLVKVVIEEMKEKNLL